MAKDSLAKATVHEPLGTHPLWNHPGMMLPAYIQHIAKDIHEKRGMPLGRAIAIAVGAVKRWARGGDNVDKNTRAAAVKALAEWEKIRAEAHARSAAGTASRGMKALNNADDEAEQLSLGDDPNQEILWLEERIAVDLALANALSLSPDDMAKVRPLIDFYGKQPNPYRACMGEIQQRVPNAQSICSAVRELALQAKRIPAADAAAFLAEDDEFISFAENVTDEFRTWLEQVGEEEIQLMTDEAKLEELELSEDDHVLAELFFDDDGAASEDDGLVWKTILREGQWKYTPSKDGPRRKDMTIVKNGKSSKEDLVVSMAELKRNFEAGHMEHVTVPLSHDDEVDENTGFVRKLRWGKDKDGRATLEAGIDFTEPEIKEKALRGTIANTSGGILFDHIVKDSGKKLGSILGHVALTNHPWLNGMEPFGAALSDEPLEVLAFAEATHTSGRKEDTRMPDDKTPEEVVAEALGLTIEEAKAKIALAEELEVENSELKKTQRDSAVAEKVKAWQDEGKSPAVLTVAEAALLSDLGSKKVELLLSEDGKTKKEELTLSEIVSRLVDASPKLNLSDDPPVSDGKVAGEKPADEEENKEIELSQDEAREARRLFLYESYSQEDAVNKVLEARKSE